MRSLSAVASAITSADASTIARLTCASSWSLTVTPSSGCRLQIPSTHASARTWRSASTAVAPTVTCASFSSRPPISTTSARGCAASATATGGELVSTVQSRSAGRRRASSSAVVPPSSSSTRAPSSSGSAASARCAFASGETSRRWAKLANVAGPRERPAVHALHQPAGGQLAQVAPHRVLRYAERGDELGRDDLAVALEAREDDLAALGGQHPCWL